MSKWMCDVIGKQPTSEEAIKEVYEKGITSETLEEFIGERGQLSTNVKEYIKALGYKWSDSGGGKDNWHLGVPFDDFTEACSYLSKMVINFHDAIKAGLIQFKLMTWTAKDWENPKEPKD